MSERRVHELVELCESLTRRIEKQIGGRALRRALSEDDVAYIAQQSTALARAAEELAYRSKALRDETTTTTRGRA